jgi:diphthamide synthase (EF-2-diphthine--ammonia ligase)
VEVGTQIVLVTTFDAESREIAHQDTKVSDAVAQAQALETPLMGVPLPRGGDKDERRGGYIEVVQSALELIRNEVARREGSLIGLAFGDLHLMHVRTWREAARLQKESEQLIFPLWKRSEEDMIAELESCSVPCIVSSVAEEGKGLVEVGEPYTREVWKRVRQAGKDGFGENGEFHTLAKVWEAPRQDAHAALEW